MDDQLVSINDFRPDNIVIHSGGEALVTISLKDGAITYGPNYEPEKAAKVFWESLSSEYRNYLRWKAEHPETR